MTIPTYVYRDRQTGETFEIERSIRDDSPVVNPQTGSPDVEKVMQPVAIAFKGPGFYVNDSGARR